MTTELQGAIRCVQVEIFTSHTVQGVPANMPNILEILGCRVTFREGLFFGLSSFFEEGSVVYMSLDRIRIFGILAENFVIKKTSRV